jgi:hypothetical protein
MARTFDVIQIANTSSPRAVAIPSPAAAGDGAEIIVRDTSGGASTNNITITPTSGLIAGAATFVISQNHGSVTMVSDGAQWRITVKTLPQAVLATGTGKTVDQLITALQNLGLFRQS